MGAPTAAPSTAQILANPHGYPPPPRQTTWMFVGRAVEHKTGQTPGFYPWARVHCVALTAPTAEQATTWALDILGPPRRHDHWHIEWTDITPCRR